MLAAGGARGHAGGRDAEPPSLPAGRTTIGTAARDIVLQGPGLAPQHCYIENVRGTLTLHPCGNACAIDGVPLRRPTRLTQGERERAPAFAGGVVPPGSGVFGDPSCRCTSQLGCSCLSAAGWGCAGRRHRLGTGCAACEGGREGGSNGGGTVRGRARSPLLHPFPGQQQSPRAGLGKGRRRKKTTRCPGAPLPAGRGFDPAAPRPGRSRGSVGRAAGPPHGAPAPRRPRLVPAPAPGRTLRPGGGAG